MGHSCGGLLKSPKVNRFVRDFLQKSYFKSTKRAFRTRLLPKVTHQSSKTSISYETSSKTHTSSLQNKCFIRDFLQKSRVKSPKRAFRTRRPPKLTRQNLQNEHYQAGSTIGAHTSSSPAKHFRDSSPSEQRLRARQSQCHSDITCPRVYHAQSTAPRRRHTSQPHDSLRLPRNSHFHTSKPHKVLHLPRKVTISYHVSFNKICTADTTCLE